MAVQLRPPPHHHQLLFISAPHPINCVCTQLNAALHKNGANLDTHRIEITASEQQEQPTDRPTWWCPPGETSQSRSFSDFIFPLCCCWCGWQVHLFDHHRVSLDSRAPHLIPTWGGEKCRGEDEAEGEKLQQKGQPAR